VKGISEEALRRAMEAQAQAVEVSPDALTAIRSRIAGRRRWLRWSSPRLVLTTALAAGVTVVALVAGTASCFPSRTRHEPAGPTPPVATAPAPATTAAGPRGATAGPPLGDLTAPATPGVVGLAVYYTGQSDRLYREFHRLPVGAGSAAERIKAALAEMLRAGSPLDPDYRSLWGPGVTLGAVGVSGRLVTVELSGVALGTTDAAGRRAALEQLVWTATQVTGVDGVRPRLSGPDAAALNSLVPAGGVLHRRPQLDVLAPVWVIDPQQGMTVGRTFAVVVDGSVFESSAVLRVRDASGTVVLERSVQVGSVLMPNRAAATVPVTLPAGRYTVEGFYWSMKDGSVQSLDNHVFTVR
jgi:hypothetical protein